MFDARSATVGKWPPKKTVEPTVACGLRLSAIPLSLRSSAAVHRWHRPQKRYCVHRLPQILCFVLSILGASCVLPPPSVQFVRTGGAAAKSGFEDCIVPVFTMAPRASFEEVGVFEFFPSGIASGERGKPDLHTGAEGVEMARKLSARYVCANGGNALVLGQINAVGVYKRATVIRLPGAK